MHNGFEAILGAYCATDLAFYLNVSVNK